MSEKAIIVASNVSKVYKSGVGEVRAVDNLSFEVNEGEFVVILGPSGAGKTTLLNLMGGMDGVTSGELVIDGENLTGMSARELTRYRRTKVGFVFQFYNLMPNLTAIENIELAVELCPEAKRPEDVMERVGLRERMNNFPAQLSGGEQQRVSIARAVAKNPRLLLCDEPTGALDYETGKRILQLLQDMCREENKTVIIVTHNAALKDMADKVIYIKNGKADRVEINAEPKPVAEIEW
ncbi:MAG TPA: macrolide ABC transporter ATP-binding protein [Clostridiales bacterium]|nr:macrolide ABC transporter ATP-binding protein [Clostridiales bacterium]